ncbi:hypothetical protein K431DRAFT_288342 [Polychaeton citri CBS 116435]|uniref:Uncharacterized protein n=1 Tax=Polychaeton citri CBS 116435 TaxID=1314669 RepID=A0A9P4PZ52_9PEZI|nr:hypothetical protein K431DRAFT_288342 [Polychaeton citri CBS 116435]
MTSTPTTVPNRHYDHNGDDQGHVNSNDIVRVPINTTKLSQQEQASSLSPDDHPPPYTPAAASTSTATDKPRHTSLLSARALSSKLKESFRNTKQDDATGSTSDGEGNDNILLLPMTYADYMKYWRKKPSVDGVVENEEYAEDVVEPKGGRLEWVRRQMEEEWVIDMVEQRERRLRQEAEEGRGKKEKVRYKVYPWYMSSTTI